MVDWEWRLLLEVGMLVSFSIQEEASLAIGAISRLQKTERELSEITQQKETVAAGKNVDELFGGHSAWIFHVLQKVRLFQARHFCHATAAE